MMLNCVKTQNGHVSPVKNKYDCSAKNCGTKTMNTNNVLFIVFYYSNSIFKLDNIFSENLGTHTYLKSKNTSFACFT